MKSINDTVLLNNKYKIPCLGFGTWQTPDGETAIKAVKCAIENGYRHIDDAAGYGNEKSVGVAIEEALAECNIKREELFITSKVWNTERGYEKTIEAFEKTLKDLRLEYLDLYLIHWPANAKQFENWDEINLDTWRAMTDLYKDGKIKAIGVSNFLEHHLKSLLDTEIKPMVNQIEFHPGMMQKETVDFCIANNIVVEAWSPLGTGRMLSNDVLIKIAKKYNRSVAQICIRWALQNKVVPLPKSITPSRIIENTQVFDFEIEEMDMVAINNMKYCGGSGLNPDEVDF
ncbi:aldo/keto reductase [Anaerotignum sp.]|uniref:aldo/keto reductase n=1 Tax=Anaerotignum sp. TaxID=2039241 RepID=UPI002714C907|nr:aldo/keto reductase [Anaerotignum sp.]